MFAWFVINYLSMCILFDTFMEHRSLVAPIPFKNVPMSKENIFHTGLVSDKHKLGIGKQCIYWSLDKNKISFLLGKKCGQKSCKLRQ